MLQLIPNDNAREARPGVWIFKGKFMVLLVVGVAIFVGLFRIFSACDLDWFIALPLSLVPLGGLTLIVYWVRGKSDSWAIDLFLWQIWKLLSSAYMAGLLDKPVPLWMQGRALPHPREF